jgi:hypothetical protein
MCGRSWHAEGMREQPAEPPAEGYPGLRDVLRICAKVERVSVWRTSPYRCSVGAKPSHTSLMKRRLTR